MTENSNSQSSTANSITEIEIEPYYSVSDASETVKGIVKLATTEESIEGTDDTKAITPLKLKETLDTQPKPEWGQITGDLKDQVDLSNALNTLETSIDDLNTTKADAETVDNEIKDLQSSISTLDATKADKSEIPTKVSQLQNDSGYLTSIPEEYVTETELENKGYLTSIPEEYVTETELTTVNNILQSDINTREKTSNKSNILSSTSTDEQYPTSKVVYDTITDLREAVTGDISNLADFETYVNNTFETKASHDSDMSAKADSSTAVTHEANAAVGNNTVPVYINSNGKAVVCAGTINTISASETSNTKMFLTGVPKQSSYILGLSNVNNFIDTDNMLNTVTAPEGDSSTKVATTAFVQSAISNTLGNIETLLSEV